MKKSYLIIATLPDGRHDFVWEGLTPEDAKADLLKNLEEDGFTPATIISCIEQPQGTPGCR